MSSAVVSRLWSVWVAGCGRVVRVCVSSVWVSSAVVSRCGRCGWTYVFDPDGPDPETLTSDSTLRFRDRAETEADLVRAGFDVVEVRDAPDRPGRELVFVARTRGESDAS